MKQKSEVLYVTSVEGPCSMMCYFWCPGCDTSHCFWVADPDKPIDDQGSTLWTWNGEMTKPTFTPSLLLYSHKTFDEDMNVVDTFQCHLFLTDGVFEFLNDSTHALAGQKVPMIKLPEFYNLTS